MDKESTLLFNCIIPLMFHGQHTVTGQDVTQSRFGFDEITIMYSTTFTYPTQPDPISLNLSVPIRTFVG